MMLGSRRTMLTLAAGFALAGPMVTAGAWADDELPITDITLYRSGVGAFLRRGTVEGTTRVQIRFRTDQMNDILKSMILLDLDGGEIDAVSYSSKEPLSKRLASFAIDISDSPSVPELLSRLRGAEIELTTIDEVIRGTVLGVESRSKSLGDNTVLVPFVNLVTASGLRSADITAVSNIRILDEQLAEELNKALAALAEHRADTVKSVELGFRGEGRREVVVSYVHEMPVWKTSYRLILPENPSAGQTMIQGWAIVENTTDEDWTDVTLSLVAGQPVGFQMDLYQPLFVPRPMVPVPVLAGLAPTVYEGGFFERAPTDPEPDMAPQFDLNAMLKSERGGSPFRVRSESLDAAAMGRYAARAQATANEVGEVFQFTLDAPVSLERQQSAMLPILASPLKSRRVSIYNRQNLASNPMRGVEMTNTSGLQLMPGPIAVFDGSAYAGDAQIGHVSRGDKRLLSYAVDLDVDVIVEDKSTNRIESIRIVDGQLLRTSRSLQSVRYEFDNNDEKRPRTVLVEQARLAGWELVDTVKPVEKTESLYRFEIEIEPGGDETLTVAFERIERQTLGIASVNTEQMLVYSRSGRVSKAVMDAFAEAGRLRGAVEESRVRISRLENERKNISRDQTRVRLNMNSIDRTSQLYRRYITKLGEQETRIEGIEGELKAARDGLARQEAALTAYLKDLTVN